MNCQWVGANVAKIGPEGVSMPGTSQINDAIQITCYNFSNPHLGSKGPSRCLFIHFVEYQIPRGVCAGERRSRRQHLTIPQLHHASLLASPMPDASDSSSLTSFQLDHNLLIPPNPIPDPAEDTPPTKKVVRARKRKTQKVTNGVIETSVVTTESITIETPPRKRKRAQKRVKQEEPVQMPLLSQSLRHVLRIGAHVSVASGVENSIPNAVQIGYPPRTSSFVFVLTFQGHCVWVVSQGSSEVD